MRPFLKFPGNKYRIIDRIKASLPPGKRLIEPFVGSGAVFLNTDYPAYLLSDSNRDLITLYRMVQKEGRSFITYARTFFKPAHNRESVYYARRLTFNRTKDARKRSALFLYLNRHCYNGLCRYNARGEFNTPFGDYQKPYFPEKELLNFHVKSRRAAFRHADFTVMMEEAVRGDVVYCDPPFVPLSDTANFTSYSAGGFTLERQLQLADLAGKLARRGVTVVISNHNTAFIQKAYSRADMVEFDVRRSISCIGSGRRKVAEVLAVFS